MKRYLRQYESLIIGFCSVLFCALAILIVVSRLNLPFGWQLLTPSFSTVEKIVPTGSLIETKQLKSNQSLQSNQIISFREPNSHRTAVGRINNLINDNGRWFYAVNGMVIPSQSVVGLYKAHQPYLGYWIQFAMSTKGLLILILLPALLIIGRELRTLLTPH